MDQASEQRVFKSHSEIIEAHLRIVHSLRGLNKHLFHFAQNVFVLSCTVRNNLLTHAVCIIDKKVCYSSVVNKGTG